MKLASTNCKVHLDQLSATLSMIMNLAASSSTPFTINQKKKKKELLELISTTVSNILTLAEERDKELNIDFSNIDAADCVPDDVKCLRESSGKSGEFNS